MQNQVWLAFFLFLFVANTVASYFMPWPFVLVNWALAFFNGSAIGQCLCIEIFGRSDA